MSPRVNAMSLLNPPYSRGQYTNAQYSVLVHFHLRLPLQQRHASQVDVDVVDTVVEEVPSPFSHLGNTRQGEVISIAARKTHYCYV